MEGITVIAGENNTGKSTIGKTVFALLQGMYNWNDIYISLCQINLKKVLEYKKIYTRLKKYCKDYISLYEKERQQELSDKYNDYINEWIEGVLAELVKVELDETVLQASYICKDPYLSPENL